MSKAPNKARMRAARELLLAVYNIIRTHDDELSRQCSGNAWNAIGVLDWCISGSSEGEDFETLLLGIAESIERSGGLVKTKTGERVDVLKALATGKLK